MSPGDIIHFYLFKKTNTVTAWLKWDESKTVKCHGTSDLTMDSIMDLAAGQIWQKYGQDIIDYIVECYTGMSRL